MAKGQIKQAQIKIDQDQFERLCEIQCVREEIAAFFKVSMSTLGRWCVETYGENFEDVYKIYRSGGKISLRRAQWTKATHGKGDTTMLIWLGKQYLEQTDKVESENIERVQIVNDIKPEQTDR